MINNRHSVTSLAFVVIVLLLCTISIAVKGDSLPFKPPAVYRNAHAHGFAYLPSASNASQFDEYHFQQIVNADKQRMVQIMIPVQNPSAYMWVMNDYANSISYSLTAVPGSDTSFTCTKSKIRSNPFTSDPYTAAFFGGYKVLNGTLVALIKNVYASEGDPLTVTLDAFTHDLVAGFHELSGVHVRVTKYVLGQPNASYFELPPGMDCQTVSKKSMMNHIL